MNIFLMEATFRAMSGLDSDLHGPKIQKSLVGGNNQIAVQTDFKLRAFIQLHLAAFKQIAGPCAQARASCRANCSTFFPADYRA